MTVMLIVPLLIAAVVAVAATTVHRRLPPHLAAPLLTVTLVASALTVVPAAVVLGFAFVAHLPLVEHLLGWCRAALGLHTPVPPWLGWPALALSVSGGVRFALHVRLMGRLSRRTAPGVEVVTCDEPFAYTLPGRAGPVVLSTGLLAALDADELDIVLAHESAHVAHRHDRYLMVANLVHALVPPLRPLQRRLSFVLERWADEAAVAATGGDRRRVARTLARVALKRSPAPLPGFAGLGVPARVEELMAPRAMSRVPLWVAIMVLGIGAVVTAGTVQAHHLAPFVAALWPG